MTFEQFKELNKEYRLVCDWDATLTICDKDSLFIPCYDNKGMIFWVSEDILGMIMYTSPYVPIANLKEKYNIELNYFGELSNYYLAITDDIYKEVFDVFKAKKQAQRPIPPHSIRNVTTFLRVMQNIHPSYKEELDKFIFERKL